MENDNESDPQNDRASFRQAADLRCPVLNVAGTKAPRAGQMSAAIALTPYTYSDTNGHEAMAPMAAISQSGRLRPALLLASWVTRPVRHQGTMASERT